MKPVAYVLAFALLIPIGLIMLLLALPVALIRLAQRSWRKTTR